MIQKTKLDNGLTLLSEEMDVAPVVTLQAWVDVGSADEAEAEAGVAHLHEHMLFKGTARRGVGQIAREVEAGGGEINAWTSFDQTVYHLVLADQELGLGLDILADVLRNSAFDPEELEREIEVVVEEIRRAQDVPSHRVANALFATAYGRHPYRRPVIGSEETVRGLDRDTILRFYRHNYRPEHVTVVVAGNFQSADLLARVEDALGSWGSEPGPGKPGKKKRSKEPPQQDVRIQVLREQVKETRLALAWHIPGIRHADIAAVDALSVILGYGDSSRLYLETRRRRQLVNDVYAYAYTPRDPGLLLAGAGLPVGNLHDAMASILDQSYGLTERLIDEGELDKAKVLILSEAAYQRETVQGEAKKLGFFEVVAGDYRFEHEYKAALEKLSPENIREVARRYLTATPTVVVQLPEEEEVPAEEELEARVADRYAAARRRAKLPQPGSLDVTRLQLDNGATLLVKEEDGPVVAMRAVALGGMRYEPKESSGVANLFAYLWGQATYELPAAALARRVALLGGTLSAFAGRNSLGLRGEFIREKSREGLRLFLDALVEPQFSEADLERERAVVLERIRSREDNPAGIAYDSFAARLYPSHPYGRRQTGDQETVTALTLEDILAYQKRYARGDKMVVSVVGAVDRRRTLDVLAEALSGASSEPLPPPFPPDAPPTERCQVRKHLDKEQAHVVLGSMGATVDNPHRFPLEVMSSILSGQSGRLFLDLRDAKSLAYSVSSSSLEGLDPGHFLVHIGTAPDKVPKALEGIYEHLARLREEPVAPEELERAQRYLIGTHAIDLQRAGSRAMLMALAESFGLGYDDHCHYAESIRGVTIDAIREVAVRYLAPEGFIEVVVGP